MWMSKGGETTRKVSVTCETTPDESGNYPDIVKGIIYTNPEAPVPTEPPGGAEELPGFGGSTFTGSLNNALCGKLWPLPQFKIAVWAGFEDPEDEEVIN